MQTIVIGMGIYTQECEIHLRGIKEYQRLLNSEGPPNRLDAK